MSHFYGTLQGNRGEATRCGTKNSGMETIAASWNGAIKTHVWHDSKIDRDRYEVWEIPWKSTGYHRLIESGVIHDLRFRLRLPENNPSDA